MFTTWKEAHTAAAAVLARQLGHDVGLWRAVEFGEEGFNIRSLPRPENRYGHELQCEVVSPRDPAMTPQEFRDACERFGLTQEAAAEFLGVSLRTAHGYANGAPIPEATSKLLRLMIRRGIKPENV